MSEVTLWKPATVDGQPGMHGNPLFDREGAFVRVADYDALLARHEALKKAAETSCNEIEWFVSRKTNLARDCGDGTQKTWADVLAEDLQPLRAALAAYRAATKEG